MIKLSPSQLNSWKNGTWFDRYLRAQPFEKNIYMEVGIAFDFIVKSVLAEKGAYWHRADKAREDWDGLSDKAKALGRAAYNDYKRVAPTGLPFATDLEMPIKWQLDGCVVTGYLDCLGGQILDWKVKTGATSRASTGYIWGSRKNEKRYQGAEPRIPAVYKLQLTTYACAVRQPRVAIEEVIFNGIDFDLFIFEEELNLAIEAEGLKKEYETLARFVQDFDFLCSFQPDITLAQWEAYMAIYKV